MSFEEKNNLDTPSQLNDVDALYLSAEKARMKEAILRSDMEKFLLFTRMIRINNTLKKAKIIHKKTE